VIKLKHSSFQDPLHFPPPYFLCLFQGQFIFLVSLCLKMEIPFEVESVRSPGGDGLSPYVGLSAQPIASFSFCKPRRVFVDENHGAATALDEDGQLSVVQFSGSDQGVKVDKYTNDSSPSAFTCPHLHCGSESFVTHFYAPLCHLFSVIESWNVTLVRMSPDERCLALRMEETGLVGCPPHHLTDPSLVHFLIPASNIVSHW
jgi:hypothetical protein